MRLDVRHAELGRLNLEMLDFDAVRIEASQVEAIENAEGDQRGEALPVWRQFVNSVALEVDAERRDPNGRMFAEIL